MYGSIFRRFASLCRQKIRAPSMADAGFSLGSMTAKSVIVLVLVPGTGSCSGLVDEEQMETFFSSLGNTSMTVYPTYIKRMAIDQAGKPSGHDAGNSGYESTEAERLAAFIRCESMADVTVSSEAIPLDKKWQRSQYGILKASSRAFGDYVASHPIDTDYAVLAEYVIPYDKVWAVHAYVVNARGDLVWLLHLNEHFDVFTSVDPRTPRDATDVLLNYLRQGWPTVQQVTGAARTDSPKIQAGVLDDFETALPSGSDVHGIPIGFATFRGPESAVSIFRTSDHPPLPGESTGNHVLKLDMNVRDWAGFLHGLENDEIDTWVPQNWHGLEGFRFWLHGNNSGAKLNVDVIDNRKGCAAYDDAERYRYEFVDDFSGWKQITVEFSSMVREDIGNRAPNDGFGLNEVHGWGFGTANKGSATYYIDDFELLGNP